MADPIWLADVLRAEGLNVIEHDGWKERGHGDFLDIRGVICHHTAGGGVNDWKIVQYGRSDLPGPLAQLVLERDGTFRVIAAGVCWHAGRGSWAGWPTNNANYHTIGIEAVNNGTGQEWPAVQLDAYKRGVAAILRHENLNANACAGHKEYSSEGKIDPYPLDMWVFRADVQHIIENGSNGDDMSWGEQIKNLAGQPVSREDMIKHMDARLVRLERLAYAALDQLAGAGVANKVANGEPAAFDGFMQGGNRSAYDLQSAIAERVGVPNAVDLKKVKK